MNVQLFILVVYLITCPVVTGTCDVHNSAETNLQRCSEIQKCVNQALISDERNMYVLEKVFRSSNPRPAVAVIINYYLRWTEITTQANSSGNGLLNEEIQRENGFGSGSGSGENLTNHTESVDTGDNNNMIQTLEVQIGWSSSGIYTAVRPEILLSLQPGLLLFYAGFAIDNYGYPKTTDLYLNLSQCNLPSHTNYANYNEELKEALEHLTMRLDYNSTQQLAYVWETSTTPFLCTEELLFIIIPILALCYLILFLTGLPNTILESKYIHVCTCTIPVLRFSDSKHTIPVLIFAAAVGSFESKHTIPVLIFAAAVGSIIFLDTCFWIFLSTEFTNMTTYVLIHVILSLMTIGVCIIVGVITALMNRSHLIQCRIHIAILYILGSLVPAYLLITFIPLLMFTIIYPLETIPILSFGIAIIAGIIITDKVRRRFGHKNSLHMSGNKSRTIKKYYYRTVFTLYYGLVPFAFSYLLVLYLGTLNILSESPTNNFFTLLLAFVPSVLTTTLGVLLNKKLGQVKKPNTSTNESSTEQNTAENRAEGGDIESGTELNAAENRAEGGEDIESGTELNAAENRVEGGDIESGTELNTAENRAEGGGDKSGIELTTIENGTNRAEEGGDQHQAQE